MSNRTSIPDCAGAIRAAVARGDYGEAVRRVEAVANERVSGRQAVAVALLIRGGGQETAEALAEAFARAPCYFCKDGRTSCDACGGAKTFAANGKYCDACGGHGLGRCAFCGGSGLVPLESVPSGLRRCIAARRVAWTAGVLRDVVQQLARLAGGGLPEHPLGECMPRLDALRRIAAVVAECRPVVANPAAASATDAAPGRAAELARECALISAARRRALAEALAAYCSRRATAEAVDALRRVVWERQAEFFRAQVE